MNANQQFCNIEVSFRQAMRDAGLDYDGDLVADGGLYRFKIDGDTGRPCWYVLHADGIPAGSFGCYKRGIDGTWCSKSEHEFTNEEKIAYRKQLEAVKAKRDADQAKRQGDAATQALAIISAAQPATDDHAYLTRKLVSAYAGTRIGDWPQRKATNCLLLPFSIDGRLTTIEAIAANGSLIGDSGKDWLFGGKKSGASFEIGNPELSDSLVFSEGYSTGASIHEATGFPVIISGDAGNLSVVAKHYRAKYATKRLLIAADNDLGKDTNTGLNAAKTASKAVSGLLVVPEFTDQEIASWKLHHNKYPTDFNDMRTIRGLAGVCTAFESATAVIDESKPSKDSLLVRTDTKGNMSLLPHNEAAELLYREDFNGLVNYDPIFGAWFQYQASGIFKVRPDLSIQQAIYYAISKHCGELGFSASYVASVSKFLMIVSVKESNTPDKKVCFQNGVLDLDSRKLLNHSPDYFFTSQLPFEWQPRSPDPTLVIEWLKEATGGHDDQVELLRAWFHAIIIGRPDLQRFLEVIGFGGSGKGTLIRLCMAIVGKEATHSTMLKQLEENRFETAKIFGKKLVIITDAEKWHGGVDVLKSIIGQDSIRFEEKNRQSGDSFTYGGMLMIAANQHINSTDYSSGIQRRRITMMFDHVVPVVKRRDLDAEFEPLLSGVVRWALDMPASEVTSYLLNTQSRVKSLYSARLESLTATNPIVGWLMDSVRFDEKAETQIGTKGQITKTIGEGSTKESRIEFEYWQSRLYPNYCYWCKENNKQPIGIQTFSRTVVDACRNMLGKQFVDKGDNSKNSKVIKGITLLTGHSTGDSTGGYVIDSGEEGDFGDQKEVLSYGKPDRDLTADLAQDMKVCRSVSEVSGFNGINELLSGQVSGKTPKPDTDPADDVEYF